MKKNPRREFHLKRSSCKLKNSPSLTPTPSPADQHISNGSSLISLFVAAMNHFKVSLSLPKFIGFNLLCPLLKAH